MNERIKELTELATTREPFYPAGCNGHPDYLCSLDYEKFAELIITDCISQCRGVGGVIEATHEGEEARRFKAVAESCEKMIKLRFGVE